MVQWEIYMSSVSCSNIVLNFASSVGALVSRSRLVSFGGFVVNGRIYLPVVLLCLKLGPLWSIHWFVVWRFWVGSIWWLLVLCFEVFVVSLHYFLLVKNKYILYNSLSIIRVKKLADQSKKKTTKRSIFKSAIRFY